MSQEDKDGYKRGVESALTEESKTKRECIIVVELMLTLKELCNNFFAVIL